MMNRTSYYETVRVSDKISLEEFILSPTAWLQLLVVAFFAPATLFKSVKYGGTIGLPSALFVLLNTFYCTALLHSGGMLLEKSIVGGLYVSLIGYVLWVVASVYLHFIRKKMSVHPRFKHFMRFAVWNQLICLIPFTLVYAASFIWPVIEVGLALLVCLSFGYSIYGFIRVFKPRSLVAPMATIICAFSLFATLSITVGLRGVDGEHTVASAWMDPMVAVPRLEYHYHNEKRVMVAKYEKWKNPNYKDPKRTRLASN